MRQIKTLIITLIVALATFSGAAVTRYSNSLNNFGTIEQSQFSNIIKDKLVIRNTDNDVILFDTTKIKTTDYKYAIKFSKLNKEAGTWGMAFDIEPNGNYWSVEITDAEHSPHNEITDNKFLNVSLCQTANGTKKVIANKQISKKVNMDNGSNTLNVQASEHGVIIGLGRKEVETIFQHDYNRTCSDCRVGILAGRHTTLEIARTMLTYSQAKTVSITTKWDKNALDRHFASSTDPLEGYWQYLDRDLEDKWLKLGGRYKIAIVSNEHDGYDIIYVDGAQVKPHQWHEGMLKGTMSKTIFNDNYDATWIDATHEPINEDVQATTENGVILTLRFPIYKSSVRFSKTINPGNTITTSGHE